MSLSEVYFFMIIIICQLFSMFIISTSEDLKELKYFRKYFKITLFIGFIGIIMEVFNWNFFCNYSCILLTFSPFITLITIKCVIKFYERVFKREPFQLHYGKLSDGIWVTNKGDYKYKSYYAWYSTNILSLPIFIMVAIFLLIDKNFC